MLPRLYQNHVLANLAFGLVLVLGFLAYGMMPREQDPTINFNWIDITTVLPGAAAADVERRVTEVLERNLRTIADIRFVSSVSREGISDILVRFEDIDERTFDKRVADLRREVQNAEEELPEEATTPFIFEITTANAYPSAVVAIVGAANDENLRRQASAVKKDIERIKGVDRILETALHDPELHVDFDPAALEAAGIRPSQLADTVAASFRDISAGSARVSDRNWLVRILGADTDPAYVAGLPVLGAKGEVPLGDVAAVQRGREKADKLVRFEGRPAVMLGITKKASVNTLDLVARIGAYVDERNRFQGRTGVEVVLIDDQTETTRQALHVMETNAVYGLLLVLAVTWFFLGTRMAVFTTLGIPFALAGTFWVLQALGYTLNVTVLLGVVIALGMLVDDAVVVVESIYYRLQRGERALEASIASVREVFAPVTSSVLTTMAAFMPLMLLPGILGKFMMIVPLVVTIALAVSLLEAYWMIPVHVVGARLDFSRPSRIHRLREALMHRMRVGYTRLLVKAMRWPRLVLGTAILLFLLSLLSVGAGGLQDPFTPRFRAGLEQDLIGQVEPGQEAATAEGIITALQAIYPSAFFAFLAEHAMRIDFFASDPIRLFYVNVQMPAGTPLEITLAKVEEIEGRVRALARPGELRNVLSYAGQMFTETAPFFGEHFGQVLVSLNPGVDGLRTVDEMMDAMRQEVLATPGPAKINFLRIAGGPPTARPIVIKVLGDEIAEVRRAVAELKRIMQRDPAVRDITDDDSQGQMELAVQVNQDAARRAGLSPAEVMRTLALLIDGEIVARIQEKGDELQVRVRARPGVLEDIRSPGRFTLPTSDGGRIALHDLLEIETRPTQAVIRHYNFRRAVTVEADLDKGLTDTLTASTAIQDAWEAVRHRYPNVDLDWTGELDDIQESLDSIAVLFLFGIGLMYLILGTQFQSYLQPFMILATVPMAFTGVVAGLVLTQNPLSLYTLYGVVALAGIAVNSAIVLISAANDRREAGMSVLHATVYAARRRLIPILITSTTTVAGLLSLAVGLGGQSLIWGPVATAIVWGLTVSTLLTLFVVPLLYRRFMDRRLSRFRPYLRRLLHLRPGPVA